MEAALAELKERLGKLTDVRRTGAVLVWDMTVFMPPGGAPTRAAQLGTIEEIAHELETTIGSASFMRSSGRMPTRSRTTPTTPR